MGKCCFKSRCRKNHEKHLLEKHGIVIKARKNLHYFKCKFCRRETTNEDDFISHQQVCKTKIFPTRMGKINNLHGNVFIYNNNL